MIDLSVLHRPLPHSDFFVQKWEECKASIPIEYTEYQTEKDSTFNLRTKTYQLGDKKYVSHVNDDDLVIGNPFLECIEILEKNNDFVGVYTNSLVEENGARYPFYSHETWTRKFHIREPLPVHELVTMRRDILEKALKLANDYLKTVSEPERVVAHGEQFIYTAMAHFGDWKFLPNTFGYVWRKHEYGTHNREKTMALPYMSNLYHKKKLINGDTT